MAWAGPPQIVLAEFLGATSPVVGCRVRPTVLAVVDDPDGDASAVLGSLTLDGVQIGSASLRLVSTPPPGAGMLPPGRIFTAALQIRATSPGQLAISLTATDRLRNTSGPEVVQVPMVANAPPVLGDIVTGELLAVAGLRNLIDFSVEVSDDCQTRRVSVEIDLGDGRGFRRVGSLRDDGRNGDAVAADGTWTGMAKLSFRAPGTFPMRLRAEDSLGASTSSAPLSLTVIDNANLVSGNIYAAEGSAADGDVNNPLAPFIANDTFAGAQDLPSPVTLGGYVNIPGFGARGPSFFTGDEDDFFRVPLAAGQTISLTLGDDPALVDLDLCLYDVGQNVIDCSLGTGPVESITAPSTGTFYVKVFPYAGCDCGSNYVLSIGQDAPASGPGILRLSDPMVPGQVIVRLREESPGGAGAAPDLVSRARTLGMRRLAGAPGREALLGLEEDDPGRSLEQLGADEARRKMRARLPGITAGRSRALDTILAVKALRRRADVATADPNALVRPFLAPNDPLYGLQWHYPLVNLPLAWDLTTGSSGVVTAVIDTGILSQHPDLQGRLVAGYDFISSPSIARDNNGIDSNPEDPGDLAYGSTSSFHGSHVAGTIGAASNNGTGVAGVDWNGKIMPVRVLGVGGGTMYDVLQGVRFAARLPNDSGTLPPQRADVMNLSLGGGGFSQSAQDVFTAARGAGVIIVAAAGNNGTSTPQYPASYAGVVSVSAVDTLKSLAPYSSFGSAVDVAAPGGDRSRDRNGDGYGDGVLSTLGNDSTLPLQYVYQFLDGTSMAAPHVAGIVALMKAAASGMTPDQFDTLLAGGTITEDRGAAGRDDLYGFGLIDARKAVVAAQSLGGTPPGTNPSLLANPPALSFGSVLTQLDIELRNGGGGALTVTGVSDDSGGWLDLAPLSVDASGLGTYRATVNRSGLSPGTHGARITFASTANTAAVQVLVSAGGATNADAGFHFILLYDPETLEPLNQMETGATAGAYPFAFADVPVGEYLLIGGTDSDNDGFICDGGEACAAYPTIDLFEPLVVRGDRTGLSLVTSFLPGLPAGAALGGSGAVPREGLRLLRPGPATSGTDGASGLRRR